MLQNKHINIKNSKTSSIDILYSYVKVYIKCSQKLFQNTFHGIISFGFIFEDPWDLEKLATFVET